MMFVLLQVRLEARCGEKIAGSGSVRPTVLPAVCLTGAPRPE
jgi:hypothetical protein